MPYPVLYKTAGAAPPAPPNAASTAASAAANSKAVGLVWDWLGKHLTRRNIMLTLLATAALPMGYRFVSKAYEPDTSVPAADRAKKYREFLSQVGKDYPALNPALGGLVGAGLGAAYANLNNTDALPPAVLGAILGGGLGYMVNN